MKHLRSVPLSVLSATIAAAVSGTYPAWSQAQEGTAETIIVTARYREESVQETPIAITAVTADEIEYRGFSSTYEIGNIVPNASLRPAQAAYGNSMTAYIRGIGQYDFDFAFEPGVGIYIDDVYHPFTLGSQTDLLDLERVEVLRGPQGTLFGRGSIGGAIRYVTKRPTGANEGTVSVTAGSFNRIDVKASYDFSVTDDLFVRIAGVSRSREGYQDVIDFACAYPSLAGDVLTPRTVNRGSGCKVDTQGGENVVGMRSSIRWAPSDVFEWTVSADYQRDDSEAKADTLLVVDEAAGWPSFIDIPYDERFLPPNPYVSYATYDDPNSSLSVKPQSGLEKTVLSSRAEWTLHSGINLALINAYTDLTSVLATDADVSPLNMQVVDGIQDINFMQTEVRLSGSAFDSLEWTTGIFYYDGETINDQMVSIPFLSLILDGNGPTENAANPFVNAHNVHEVNNQSVYGHLVWEINDRLSLSGGVRYSDDEKIVNFDNTRVRNPRVVVADTHTDWRLGVDYQFSDSVMGYFTVSTGYRPGSYNPRPFQATQVTQVDAEESTAYEIGVKSELFDRRLRLNAAMFFTDWKTRILPENGVECLLLDLGPPPVYQSADPNDPNAVVDDLGNVCFDTVSRVYYVNQPGDIQGIELELLYQPTDRWALTAVYGYTDWDSPDINDNPNVLSDAPRFVPKDNWSVGTSYTVTLPGGGTISPRIDMYGQSRLCSNEIVVTRTYPFGSCVAPHKLTNVRVEWASPDDSWRMALGATNATDEDYYLNSFDLTAFGQPTIEGQPGAPREYYVSFQRNF